MNIQPAAGDPPAVPVLKLHYPKPSWSPETAVAVVKLYDQRMKIQPAAGDGGSNIAVALSENEIAAGRGNGGPHPKNILPEKKTQPAASDGGPSIKLAPTIQRRNSSRPPETAAPI